MKRLLAFAAFVLLAACSDHASHLARPSGADAAGWEQQRTDWYLRSVSDDGRTIAFVYTMSGVASDCERKGRPDVAETGSSVMLTAYKHVTRDRERACTEELGYVDDTVTLDDPLGDRRLTGCGGDDCRDLERSRQAGVFEFSPVPPTPAPTVS